MKVLVKRILSKFFLINSFCKKCGIDIQDFIVSNEIWEQIENDIPNGNTLCYNCFCKLCKQNDIDYGEAWKLNKNIRNES